MCILKINSTFVLQNPLRMRFNNLSISIFSAIVFSAVLSCSNGDEDVQYIDQTAQFYMKNAAGQDLLNSELIGSYISYTGNDVLGLTDSSPITFSKIIDSNGLYYWQYQAGARRLLLDSISPNEKYYHSLIALNLTKKITDSTTTIEQDTMEIRYKWTPSVFEVSKVYYNNQLMFEKQPSQPNIVTIIK